MTPIKPPSGDSSGATTGASIRPAQAEEAFHSAIRRMENGFLERTHGVLPQPVEGYPSLPNPLPNVREQINFGGWSYRCYVQGIYYAWPNDPSSSNRYLRPWMELFDLATRQMLQSLDEKAGPLIAGSIFCIGRIGEGKTRIYFPDAITAPLWFSDDPNDFEFVPIVSLAAPNPLAAFLVAMTRAHVMNGRMTDEEYWTIAGESPLPEQDVTRNHSPGRIARIGALRIYVGEQEGPMVFLESGWVPEPDHPSFKVQPTMTEPASSWPVALKREHLLGE